MDKREILRFNLKFGKFFDPVIMLLIITILSVSILSFRNLSAQSLTQNETVLGVQSENQPKIALIKGEHNHIHSEKLEQKSSNHFTYTCFVQKAPKGRISKPIFQLSNLEQEISFTAQVMYSNSRNSKISIFKEETNTTQILQKNGQQYTQNIEVDSNTEKLYLIVENERPVFFNQYVQIDFFLNL